MFKWLTGAAVAAIVTTGSVYAQPLQGVVIGIHRGVGCYAFTLNNTDWQAVDLSNPGAAGQIQGVEGSFNGNRPVSFITLPKTLPCNSILFPAASLPVAAAVDNPSLLP